MAVFPPISSLVPHAGPSCLLEAVVQSDASCTECSAQIDASHPYLQRQGVHSLLAIELFAQSSAVHRALSSQGSSSPAANGRLVGASVHLYTPELVPPLRLLVRVIPRATLGQLHSFTGRLYRADRAEDLLAEGEVSVSVQDGSLGRGSPRTEAGAP